MYWDRYIIIYYSMWQAVRSVELVPPLRSNLFFGKMHFADRYAEDLSRRIFILYPLGHCNAKMQNLVHSL